MWADVKRALFIKDYVLLSENIDVFYRRVRSKMFFDGEKKKFLFGLWLCLTTVVGVCPAKAVSPADYADRFKVDMNADIPPIEELRKMFAPKPVYDRKFDYFWNISSLFDREFAQTVRSYGTRQTRLKWPGEDTMLEQIKNTPKEYYPYIGPYLHTIPGISEKVLNLPGIKETKNRFPGRVAEKFADIDNLEFMSPALYFVLMPEIWEESDLTREKVRFQTLPQVNRYDTSFMNRVTELVPPEDFAPGAKPEEPLASRLRTISPDASSPLTSKDIQAVARSLEALADYGADIHNQAKIIEAGSLLDAWENANGTGAILPNIKDLVHPCQRLVQKIKMQGMENEFSKIIAAEGFNMEEWAYTCDKTIKAYRVLRMSSAELMTLLLYKRNIYEKQLNLYSDKIAPSIAVTMQSIVEMYDAPVENVLEVKKNQKTVKNAFERIGYRIVFQPIYIK